MGEEKVKKGEGEEYTAQNMHDIVKLRLKPFDEEEAKVERLWLTAKIIACIAVVAILCAELLLLWHILMRLWGIWG